MPLQEAVLCKDLGKWQFKALNAGIALAGFAHVMALYAPALPYFIVCCMQRLDC